MGAKLTKTKDGSTIEKFKEQQEITVTDDHTNNHLDLTKTENNQQTDTKATKKKKEAKSNKKSSTTTTHDKSTSTEHCILPASVIVEQRQQSVQDQTPTVNHSGLSGSCTTEMNAVSQTDTSNIAIQELQTTCNHEGVSSEEAQIDIEQTSNEEEDSAKKLNTDQESESNASIVVDDNSNLVNSED